MKNIWCILIFQLFALTASAQSYTRLWQQVEDASVKDLPKQALTHVKSIYEKALRENDDVQLLKSHLALIQYNYEISTDSLLPFVQRMEEALDREKRPLQRSLWHSALAQVYERNLHALMTYANLSYEKVKAKVVAEYEASLSKPELLITVNYNYKDFLPLFDEEKDSRFFNDDCLHVLYKAYLQSSLIASRDKLKCVTRIKELYRRYANRDAEVLLTLDEMDCKDLFSDINGRLTDNPGYRQLVRLYEENPLQPASLYVLLRMVAYYRDSYTVKSRSGYSLEINNYNDSILYRWIEKGLADPLYKNEKAGLNYLMEVRNSFNSPAIYVPISSREYYPLDVINVSVINRNVENLTFRIIPVCDSSSEYDAAPDEKIRRIIRRRRDVAKVYHYKPVGKSCEWNKLAVNMTVPEKPGIYALEVEINHKKVDRRIFHVTALAPLSFSVGSDYNSLTVVDRKTGYPVNGAFINVCTDRSGHIQRKYRTEDGEVRLESPRSSYRYYVATPHDWGASAWQGSSGYYYGYDSGERNETLSTVDLFTDRVIYCPGQTVGFSGVAYQRTGDTFRTDSVLTGMVFCFDLNRKVVDSLQVETDAFGVFSGSFRLPETGMNGSYLLEFQAAGSYRGHRFFTVEEYKRPTMEVRMLPSKERYRLNDSLTVEGIAETYTGLPVADALVSYRVQHSIWGTRENEQNLQSGEVRTDINGRFRFRIKLEGEDDPRLRHCYNCHFFRVNCDVTAGNGETSQGQILYTASNRRAFIRESLPDLVCKEWLPECKVSLLNADGEQTGDSIRCELWHNGGPIATEVLVSGRSFVPRSWQALPSGSYKLILSAGDEVEKVERPFTLFSLRDAQLPVKDAPLFFYSHSSAKGDSATALVATSNDEALLYYHLVAGNSLLESRRIPLTSALQRLELTYRPEFGDGATAYLAVVWHGQLYTQQYSVIRPRPDKRLSLSWTTFRSRLTPGQQEEWRLRITCPDGTPAQANLMACLYDASLERFGKHSWNFSRVYEDRTMPHANWNEGQFRSFYYSPLQYTTDSYPYMPSPLLTHWKPTLFDYMQIYHSRYSKNTSMPEVAMTDMAQGPVMSMRPTTAFAVPMELVNGVKAEAEAKSAPTDGGIPEVEIRKNFAETAFFRPSLRTDANGEITLAFTLPESMTQWNFMALAHDRAMNNGSLTAEVTARKEFMVQPALPRFVRQGDRVQIPVNVTNLTSEKIRCVVTMTLEHGITEGKILKEFSRKVELDSVTTCTVNFDFPVNFDAPCVICRVVAVSDRFSDGEEHLLPVADDEVEVTRTLPFSLREPGTVCLELPFELQGRKASHPVLEVELTSNPIWYTLSTLPVLSHRENCTTVDDWATIFYATVLAEDIVHRNPQIGRAVKQRSDELAQMILPRLDKLDDCTPWLNEGQNEARRISELQNLLDKEKSALRKTKALSWLQSLQNADGGWSWCPGMRSNVWTTAEVAWLLTRAQQLTGNREARPLLTRSYQYLRQKMAESVEQMKRYENKHGHRLPVSELQLRYLHLTVLLGEPLGPDEKFLLTRSLELRKELSMYAKAYAASLWASTGHRDEAQLALQSLLEHTTVTPENGRFFETARAVSTRSSYRIPTQCAAIELLRKFDRTTEAQEMLLWLLQAKRTQMWDTPRSSTDAVYTLLAGAGKNNPMTALDAKEPLTYTLYRHKKAVAELSADSVQNRHTTGYIRQIYTDPETLKADRIELTQTSEGLSWGAVFATCRMPETEVVKSGSGFDLTYVVEVFEKGKWTDFRLGKPLHKGMRIRRVYTLKADHDYDFVKLRTDRPACFVPVQALSGYSCIDGLWAYRMLRDRTTEFYIEHLAKGTYTLTEEYFIDRSGSYAVGVSRIDCLQAPEYTAVTPSFWLYVE